MAVMSMPEHGQVLDIGGSTITADIKNKLHDVLRAPYNADNKPTLPDELLYDDIGLPLWNQIIFTPEFYQTFDEMRMFDENGAEIAGKMPHGVTMVDLGAGYVTPNFPSHYCM